MTAAWLLPSYLLFLLFGLYAWAIGGAVFSGVRGMQGIFRLPWLGYGLLVGSLQVTHLFFPIDRWFSAGFLIVTSVVVAVVHLSKASRRSRRLKRVLKAWPTLLPLAPEPRYFGSATWLIAVAPALGLVAADRSSAAANLYLCAVPMAGLVWDTKWIWLAPDPKFPEIPRASLVEFQNSFGLRFYAPSEGNQSFDSPLPASNRSLPDIGLLDPGAGIAGPMSEKRHEVGQATP
jgi:hypothetical protein